MYWRPLLYKVYRELACFGELPSMQIFDKYFWRQQRMDSKTQECSPRKQITSMEIIPNRGLEQMYGKICMLRVIINLWHLGALLKDKWPSELWLQTCIPSNFFNLLSHSKGSSDVLNTTSTAVTHGYYKEIPDLCLLHESVVGALRTKAQNLVFTHLWCSNNRTAITFT